MPLGEGLFVHQKTLQVIPIAEHATDVKTRPEEFGIHPRRVVGLSPTMDREKLVGMVLRKGWVRIRAWRGEVHVEGIGSHKALRRIVDALEQRLGYGPMTLIVVVSWKTGEETRFRWENRMDR